ncbi:MAG: type 4a pilus biogenesis protein PilO [Elusimicrobia bacterium]|nr:type 4a pilus biogenesis protein PilO [Elusimicrobiota bacterium]
MGTSFKLLKVRVNKRRLFQAGIAVGMVGLLFVVGIVLMGPVRATALAKVRQQWYREQMSVLKVLLKQTPKETLPVRLIPASRVSAVIETMIQIGRDHGIDFISLKAEDIRADPRTQWPVAPVVMIADGDYRDIGAFLSEVCYLSEGVLDIRKIDLKALRTDLARVRASVEMALFVTKP